MKTLKIILAIFLFIDFLFVKSQLNIAFGQNKVVESTCETDTTKDYGTVNYYATQIALMSMADSNHHYHDSIIIPDLFLDSIKYFLTAYHNAISVSDSIIDYRKFQYCKCDEKQIILHFSEGSDCFYIQDDEVIITNDTLAKYIDSLGLNPSAYDSKRLYFQDINFTGLNFYGDFDFFKTISGVEEIEKNILYLDCFCVKSRFGVFNNKNLEITLTKYDYGVKDWRYKITSDCNIEILEFPGFLNLQSYSSKSALIFFYPNPFTTTLNYDTRYRINELIFYTLDGRLYKKIQYPAGPICTRNYSPGVYIVKVIYKNGLYAYQKVIKK